MSSRPKGFLKVELRLKGERAVLLAPNPESLNEIRAREIDPGDIALSNDLVRALHDWARVSSALLQVEGEASARKQEAGIVISRRGAQLAGRIACALNGPIQYHDPVTSATLLVTPPTLAKHARKPQRSLLLKFFGIAAVDQEATPWAVGLLLSGLVAAVTAITIFVLANTLRAETNDLLVFVAVSLVDLGLAPSLWLGRRLPVVRWVSLGVTIGGALSWVGALASFLVS